MYLILEDFMCKVNPEFFCFAPYLGQMGVDFSSQYIILELSLSTKKTFNTYLFVMRPLVMGTFQSEVAESEKFKKREKPETVFLDISAKGQWI